MIWCSKRQVSEQVEENLVFWKKMDVPVCQTGQSGFQPIRSAKICSAEPSSVKSDSPIFETGGSEIFRTSDKSCETMMADPENWRTPLVHYLENSGSYC
jgi:hypothetical protein